MFKNALVSCSDKTGLAEFLAPLAHQGLRIVSTGGTAQYLRDHGLKVTDVSEQTGFPEVMDGRVKTLHPKIHMALLARDDKAEDLAVLKQHELQPFDLVIGNLYPFEGKPSVETIDIGGPSFLRASAKSFARVAVICDPTDYAWIGERMAQKSPLTVDERRRLAGKLFSHTSAYDAMIARHYAGDDRMQFRDIALGGAFVQALRYGENPAQKAAWFRTRGESAGLHTARILQGKELSYNNLLDLDAAAATLREFNGESAAVAVKHNNPCGVAVDPSPAVALSKALKADPQSVFGGIVAVNFTVEEKMAEELSGLFLECVVAPKFSEAAQTVFQKKKNVRVLEWTGLTEKNESVQFRTLAGGFLVQSADRVATNWSESWQIVGAELDKKIRGDLLAAWKVCAHLKSNAIAIVADGVSVGLGMGQVNRVDAVDQAIDRMRRFHPQVKNAVLASDAFFPFADSIDKIADAGLRYVIQPGGSIKDQEVIAQAKARGVTLVLTGQRHFLH